MEGVVVKPSTWAKQPWKNGRGVTYEIWRWSDPTREDSAEGFDLRLSVARIDGEQEFSRFPGYFRALIPLDASDLSLGPTMPLLQHHVLSFSGDAPMHTRGSGSTRDLNVMSHVARARAHVAVGVAEPNVSLAHDALVYRHRAVFALTAVTVRDASRREIALEATDTWIHLDRDDARFTASAPVVWILF